MTAAVTQNDEDKQASGSCVQELAILSIGSEPELMPETCEWTNGGFEKVIAKCLCNLTIITAISIIRLCVRTTVFVFMNNS